MVGAIKKVRKAYLNASGVQSEKPSPKKNQPLRAGTRLTLDESVERMYKLYGETFENLAK